MLNMRSGIFSSRNVPFSFGSLVLSISLCRKTRCTCLARGVRVCVHFARIRILLNGNSMEVGYCDAVTNCETKRCHRRQLGKHSIKKLDGFLYGNECLLSVYIALNY